MQAPGRGDKPIVMTDQSITASVNERYCVAALYRFARWPTFAQHRDHLFEVAREACVKGTLLLASEGINGTIAGSPHGVRKVLDAIQRVPQLASAEIKFSTARRMPFQRLKVRLKTEIVTMGVPGVDPLDAVGTYVEPNDWNALISDPDTVLIDTRNAYEVGVGTFNGAENPGTRSFREFPAWLQSRLDGSTAAARPKRIAMFCTGGIRCEKATAYVKFLGFNEVFHLKGGILKYLEEVPARDSLWNGACYVFDERVAVGHGLKQAAYKLCRHCGAPVATDTDCDGGGYTEGACSQCQRSCLPAL